MINLTSRQNLRSLTVNRPCMTANIVETLDKPLDDHARTGMMRARVPGRIAHAAHDRARFLLLKRGPPKIFCTALDRPPLPMPAISDNRTVWAASGLAKSYLT
jgi:hypothetical protein